MLHSTACSALLLFCIAPVRAHKLEMLCTEIANYFKVFEKYTCIEALKDQNSEQVVLFGLRATMQ